MNFEQPAPRHVRVPPWELPPTNPNRLRGNPWFEECLRDSPFPRDTSNSITDTRSEAELQHINDRHHDRRWLERFVKGRQSL